MDTTDVLVVGAGPIGLGLASGLLAHGVSVRVADRASGPATTSRANILHARGVEVLDRLGALGTLEDRAVTAHTVTMNIGGKPVVTMRFGDVGLGTARPALVVSQVEIEAGLRRRLAELGGHVEWNAALVDVVDGDDGVVAVLGDGSRIRARWLVGADGAHSMVRKLAGIGFPGARVAEQFLLADVHADWDLDRSGTTGWYHRDGLLFAMPMRDPDGRNDRWRLMADIALSESDKPDEQAVLDRFRRLLRERAGHDGVRLREAVWTSVFRIHRRLADDYRRGRILLAGDAAHIHSPMGGQGINTGIGDAENLAWKLALVVQGLAAEPLLDTYQAERRPLAADVLRGTTAATRLQVGKGPVGRFLRDRVMAPLLNRPSVQRRLTVQASQLWVSYRRGPLGTGRWFGRPPRPGDRVGDLPCLRADGTRTRLHAELHGRWGLLVPSGGAKRSVTAARDMLDGQVVTLTPADADADEVWLVRPDAHLAWRGEPASDGLERWLDAALQHGRTT